MLMESEKAEEMRWKGGGKQRETQMPRAIRDIRHSFIHDLFGLDVLRKQSSSHTQIFTSRTEEFLESL